MANMNLVTGYAGQAHITSDDAGSLNAGIAGSGEYVLNKGNRLSASTITNNQIRVLDGDILMQGRHARIEPGTTVDLTIDNGASGYYRNDLIVARYTKDVSTGVESVSLVVIKGDAVTSSPADPAYTSGNIISGEAVQNDMPLYRIKLEGLTVSHPEQLFKVSGNFAEHINDKSNPHNVTASQVGAKESGSVESIANGGTGANNAADARTNLGITPVNIGASPVGHAHNLPDMNGILPVSKGGTGASSASSALANLGASASGHTHTLDSLSNIHISSSTPTSLTNGHWYLVKES